MILIALVFVGLAGCTGQPARPVELTVLTYNIHHAEGTDKKLDVERIANVIRALEPDLVALQEVDVGTKRTDGVDQAAELGRMTGMQHAHGPSMDFQGGKYGNAILTRIPLQLSTVVPLPHRPGGQREPRAALAATVRLGPPDGRDIVFISTHFDHTGEASDRVAQAEAVNAQLGSSPALSILAGDFNCEPGSPPMVELEKQWTRVSDGGNSYPSAGPSKGIDHILVRPGDRWRVIESTVIAEPVASDHRPVMVKLKLLPGD